MRVFLTGASSGIGAALAAHWARRGAALGLFARRGGALETLAAGLGASRCHLYAGDVRDPAALAAAAADFLSREGVPDIVVANAGISGGTLTQLAEDLPEFEAILDTNLLGAVRTFQPFVEPMRRRGSGRLVGIASVAGFRGLPGAAAYSASKAAMISWLESLRVELAGSGVRVVTVCPGYIATPMTAANPYRMPFLMPAERAARDIARAVEQGRRFYVLPWPMAIAGTLLRALPRPLYDALFARAPRKPRRVHEPRPGDGHPPADASGRAPESDG